MSKTTAAVEDLLDTASHYGTNAEAVALAEISEHLAVINRSLHIIVEAMCSGAPWNVKLA
jgi:hypothetical protein